MIKILKSGSWALGGTQVVELTEGEEVSFGAHDDIELIQAGWAEWIQAEEWIQAIMPADDPAPKPRTKAAK